METLDHRDGASLDPKDFIGRIYEGDHLTLLHARHINCGHHGFRVEFKIFPIISLWNL